MNKAAKFLTFVLIYLISVFLIVPLLAKPFGRVPLPLFTTSKLRPRTIWTYILIRNYVRPGLRTAAYDAAIKMNVKYPGTITNYLDASFPFINGFPLLPHLSHNDGKKLDISFCYNDSKTMQPTNNVPSFIGYGICEEPTPAEINTAADCERKGYWQYSILKWIVPQGNKSNFILDKQKTKELVELFAAEQAIGKIFIEPHLVLRLKLTERKIRFQGCYAVRHDDHIHVQLK